LTIKPELLWLFFLVFAIKECKNLGLIISLQLKNQWEFLMNF